MSEKIIITPIVLKDQKPTETKECFIELFEQYLQYRMEFFSTEPVNIDDHEMGWNEGVYNNFDIIAVKAHVSGIEKSYTSDKKWGIYIIINGFEKDLKVFFKTQAPAIELFDKLKNWRFNGL